MTEELRAQVVADEGSRKRIIWIILAIAVPFFCCASCFLLAWFSGDAVMEALGLTNIFLP